LDRRGQALEAGAGLLAGTRGDDGRVHRESVT
jgi:hypothetical protein